MSKELLPVIFRVDRYGVFAIFPTLPGDSDPATCTMYQAVGQHSSGDLWAAIEYSQPANEGQLWDLREELKGIYESDGDCQLMTVKRATDKMHQIRHEALARV